MQTTKTMQRKIDRILEVFDFERCSRIMQALNWQCHGTMGAAVPSAQRLHETARRLMENVAADKDITFSATGGLICRRVGKKDLELAFEIERWSNADLD